ncbi:MAG: hypothetical protein K0S47_3501 [Herbinix sp.]|jgi:hypothetical protein|nr:hypothetical protein [Herbinix sp.]
MIVNMTLVHNITKELYEKIVSTLQEICTISKPHAHTFCRKDEAIYQIELYEMDIKKPMQKYIIQSLIHFPLLNCTKDNFSEKLYDLYTNMFGNDIMASFPAYDELICDHIEYSINIKVDHADKSLEKILKINKGIPEQLDRSRWHEYKKSFGSVKYCMAKMDDTHLELFAQCDGTALKSRLKEKSLHRANGIVPSAAVSEDTENIVLYPWKKIINKTSRINKEALSPQDMITVLSGDNYLITNKFADMAKNYKLKPAVRYAPGHKTWKCVYSSSKPKRVIFTMECTSEDFKVKACLFHLKEYMKEASLSTNIKRQLVENAWNCGHCNPKCRGGVSFTIDGNNECKCVGGAFSLQSLGREDWRQVMELIEDEMKYKEATL